jgi:hypothetical protein
MINNTLITFPNLKSMFLLSIHLQIIEEKSILTVFLFHSSTKEAFIIEVKDSIRIDSGKGMRIELSP